MVYTPPRRGLYTPDLTSLTPFDRPKNHAEVLGSGQGPETIERYPNRISVDESWNSLAAGRLQMTYGLPLETDQARKKPRRRSQANVWACLPHRSRHPNVIALPEVSWTCSAVPCREILRRSPRCRFSKLGERDRRFPVESSLRIAACETRRGPLE